MNKKLMVAAVAGALALPGVALAQSSVTISGIFKVGVDNIRLGNPGAARAGANTSENRVTDNSSRIIFNVTEDLGGGLAAIAQLDLRFSPDAASTGLTTNPIGSGNTWVGVRSKTMGTLSLGRHDLHYGKNQDDLASKSGALMASTVSVMDYINAGAIAGATRTQNVVRWDSPNWSGFGLTVAWSANPTAVETDLGTTAAGGTAVNAAGVPTRKGNAWNFNPSYTAKNWGILYSYWKSKNDIGAQTVAAGLLNASAAIANYTDQRGDVISGHYRWGGLKVGAAWNKSRVDTTTLANVRTDVRRTAWSIPVSYNMRAHTFYGSYTRAGDITGTGGAALGDNKAKMWAFAYNYDLSKRSAIGLTYAKITNANPVAGTSAGSNYNFFTNNNNGGFGSANAAPTAGEDPRLIAVTLRHAF